MKCIICKKEINIIPDKDDQIHCPLCDSSYPKLFAEKLGNFEELKKTVLKYKKIEFAPQVLTDQYEDIANHFIPKILGIKGFLITDESSLLDFNFEIVDRKVKRETNKTLKEIEKVYGVDVSDVEDLNLMSIFERLRILSPVFN